MLGHLIAGEEGGFKVFLLKRYARHEVSLLGLLFRIIHSRLMKYRFFRETVYWLLAYPEARWCITGTLLAPDELAGFIKSQGGRIAVGPCRCRSAHRSCGHPLETDIVIRSGFTVWTGLFPGEYREITALEAMELCRRCHRQGMVQVAFTHVDPGTGRNFFVICNCCADGCLPLLIMKKFGPRRYPFRKGSMRSRVDPEKCGGCAACVEICPFQARSLRGGRACVSECFGCGLCVSHCPQDASRLV